MLSRSCGNDDYEGNGLQSRALDLAGLVLKLKESTRSVGHVSCGSVCSHALLGRRAANCGHGARQQLRGLLDVVHSLCPRAPASAGLALQPEMIASFALFVTRFQSPDLVCGVCRNLVSKQLLIMPSSSRRSGHIWR